MAARRQNPDASRRRERPTRGDSPRRGRWLRPGLSLIEQSVALAVVTVAASVLVPNLTRHLVRAEEVRWQGDLHAVGEAAKLYRLHVRRWPARVRHVWEAPGAEADDLFGERIPGKLLDEWKGPYLEWTRLAAVAGDSTAVLHSTKGVYVRDELLTVDWRGLTYLQIELVGVGAAEARALSRAIDGDTAVAVAEKAEERAEAGRVRFLAARPGAANGRGSLLYLAVRVDSE